MELEDWLTAAQAAEIISRNSDKDISSAYVRQLARYGKLRPRHITNRLSLYKRDEVEKIIVEDRGGKHEQKPKRRPSSPRPSAD